jgi:hypothetical protein
MVYLHSRCHNEILEKAQMVTSLPWTRTCRSLRCRPRGVWATAGSARRGCRVTLRSNVCRSAMLVPLCCVRMASRTNCSPVTLQIVLSWLIALLMLQIRCAAMRKTSALTKTRSTTARVLWCGSRRCWSNNEAAPLAPYFLPHCFDKH